LRSKEGEKVGRSVMTGGSDCWCKTREDEEEEEEDKERRRVKSWPSHGWKLALGWRRAITKAAVDPCSIQQQCYTTN
jgi:hypothetical protein